MFFELQLTLCEHFPSLSPFDIREQSVYEVFLLVRRFNESSKSKNGRKNNKNKIRKKAGDNWF